MRSGKNSIHIFSRSEKSSDNRLLNGRIVGLRSRNEGGIILEIYDGVGVINCYSLKNHRVGRGDIVSLILKKSGSERLVHDLRVITKAERQFPSQDELNRLGLDYRRKHHEISMVLNGTKKTFEQRSKIISFIRSFLENRGFVEVETPYLQSVPEIAPVPDFVTETPRHFRALHLRITNTEYMRRLLVAGFDKIYQLGRCFRDEKSSFKHHPEFTQLTFGVANHNYDYLIDLIEELVYQAALKVVGKTRFSFKGREVDLTPPWERRTMRDAIIEFAELDIEDYPDNGDLAKKMEEMGMNPPRDLEFSGFLIRNALIDRMVEDFVVPNMIKPTLVKEYPYCLGGPAKEVEGKSEYKQRCEAFAGTMEIANVSTPQNDYRKLKKWYDETLQQKIESGWLNQELDEDYLFAMSCGIPLCTTGGLGVDRLLMLILEKNDVKDVMLFPWKEVKEVTS